MEISLFMATSLDGFIAKKDGDSTWVSEFDVEIFEDLVREFWCIIVGNTTFQQYKNEVYPLQGAVNIVISKDHFDEKIENTFFVSSPQDAIKIAEEKWFLKVLLVWWWHVNWSFLEQQLVQEVMIDVHPIILWGGIKLFEWLHTSYKMNFIEAKTISWGQILLKYVISY